MANVLSSQILKTKLGSSPVVFSFPPWRLFDPYKILISLYFHPFWAVKKQICQSVECWFRLLQRHQYSARRVVGLSRRGVPAADERAWRFTHPAILLAGTPWTILSFLNPNGNGGKTLAQSVWVVATAVLVTPPCRSNCLKGLSWWDYWAKWDLRFEVSRRWA